MVNRQLDKSAIVQKEAGQYKAAGSVAAVSRENSKCPDACVNMRKEILVPSFFAYS